jgi:hypothetical protein
MDMMRLLSGVSLAAALVLGVAAIPNTASADHGHRRYHHYDGGHNHHGGGYQYSHSYYPRPSYHYDYVPHGNHIDVYRHYDYGHGHGHHHHHGHSYYQPRYYGGYRGGVSIRW